MKMIMAVVPRDEGRSVLEALIAAGYTASFVESRSGVLRQAQLTLFIAAREEDLSQILDSIKDSCQSDVTVGPAEPVAAFLPGSPSTKTRVGGAVVFVWDLETFEIY